MGVMETTTVLPTNIAIHPTTARAVARTGARDMAGLAVGYVPFALAIGATIGASPLSRLGGWAGAPIIAAGAAHLTLIELVAAGSAALSAACVAVMINARIVAYSAGLAPWFRTETAASKLLLAFFIIDPTYLLATDKFERDDPGVDLRRWYFFGLASVLYPLWMTGVAIGVVAGNIIPEALELTMAAPLMMVGMLAMSVDQRHNRAAAIVGLVFGAAEIGLPTPLVTVAAASIALVIAFLTLGRETAVSDTSHEGGNQ